MNIVILPVTTVLFLSLSLPAKGGEPGQCECRLFLEEDLRTPSHFVFESQWKYDVECSNLEDATRKCRRLCEQEIASIETVFVESPTLMHEFPPSASLQCSQLPKETLSFARTCGGGDLLLASSKKGPQVCCHPMGYRPVWCNSLSVPPPSPAPQTQNEVDEGRRIDTTKRKDDVTTNEIPGSTKPEKTSTSSSSSSTSSSWTKTAMNYFGYDSFGDFVKEVDIFSIPGKVRNAVKTYNDEISMGQCYMEFSTFKLFTKQENPFEDLLRKRRDTNPSVVKEFELENSNAESVLGRSLVGKPEGEPGKEARSEALNKVFGGLAGLLEKSETTRPYAPLVKGLLPIVSQMYQGGGGGSSSSSKPPSSSSPSPGGMGSLLTGIIGPLLSQITNRPPPTRPPSNSIDKEEGPAKWPNVSNNKRPPSSTSSSPSLSSLAQSPLASVAIKFLMKAVTDYLSPSPAPIARPVNKVDKVNHIITTTKRPTPIQDLKLPTESVTGGGLMSLLGNILKGAFTPSVPPKVSKPPGRPLTRPHKKKKPISNSISELNTSDKQEKDFIDMMLEFIRPVFISIVGKAPGESGVESIRRVSTLSTLGRLDDSMKEEVDSPFFCLKNYFVNKAWTITERGIRTVVAKFKPEERRRMMRMLEEEALNQQLRLQEMKESDGEFIRGNSGGGGEEGGGFQ